MTIRKISRMILVPALGAVLGWSALAGVGCNGQWLSQLGLNNQVPKAPGQYPFIVLRWTNSIDGADQSSAEPDVPGAANFLFTWRYAGGTYVDGLGEVGDHLVAGEDTGTILPCDITVLTAGEVDDLTATGAWISFTPPGVDAVRTPLPPFGKNLANGVDFRCGDVITFMLQPDANVAAQYTITYRVDSGENEQGPYNGPDTFSNIKRMIKSWEDETGYTVNYPYY